jgi:hypothetical protein
MLTKDNLKMIKCDICNKINDEDCGGIDKSNFWICDECYSKKNIKQLIKKRLLKNNIKNYNNINIEKSYEMILCLRRYDTINSNYIKIKMIEELTMQLRMSIIKDIKK